MVQIGLKVVVLGIGMVGLVLGLLVFFTGILGKLNTVKVTKTAQEEIPAPDMLAIEETNDKNLVAVITAAIYAIMSTDQTVQTEKSDLDFVVRSIKRI